MAPGHVELLKERCLPGGHCFVLELPIASARHSPARLSVPRPASPCHECKVLPKPLSRGPEPNLYALTLCPRLCSPLSRAMTREQSTAAAEEASPPTPTDPCATRTCVFVCVYANACTCVCAGVCVGVCVCVTDTSPQLTCSGHLHRTHPPHTCPQLPPTLGRQPPWPGHTYVYT